MTRLPLTVSAFGVLLSVGLTTSASAGAIASLDTPLVDVGNQTISAVASVEFSPGDVGSELQFFELDLTPSDVNGSPVTDFSNFSFSSSPTFSNWLIVPFGLGNYPFTGQTSAFAPVVSGNLVPYLIASPDPIDLGTVTFDYGTLGLQPGDQVTMDISGLLAATLVIIDQGTFITPSFVNASQTATIPEAVSAPEPGSFVIMGLGVLAITLGRRRRRAS